MTQAVNKVSAIRPLQVADINQAIELSSGVGWNQTAADWRLLVTLAPEGCFAFVVADRVVATITLMSYGTQLGWIGMVLTHPEFRRRGIARALLEFTIEQADRRGIETLKLDATNEGQRLYETLGFRHEQAVERWARRSGPKTTRADTICNSGTMDMLMDQEAMAADRGELLRALTKHHDPLVAPNGYVTWRDGYRANYLGPCLANDRETARELVENYLGNQQADWFWDLLPGNPNAVHVAQQLGFSPERKLLRMVRGKPLRGREELIYAIAGFELG